MAKRRSKLRLRKKTARKATARKSLRKAKKPQSADRQRRAKRQARTKAHPKTAVRRSKKLTAHTAAELGVVIAEARGNARQSQPRLAGALKSDQANIVRLEKGRSVPSVRTLFRIARATGHRLTITFMPPRG
jgi:ribosome-binding protein aMBF1 (putative translation factor)